MLSPYYYVMSSLPYLDLKIGKGGVYQVFLITLRLL